MTPSQGTSARGSQLITINGGSSTIKVAVFDAGAEPVRLLSGVVERIGSADATFIVKRADGETIARLAIGASDHDEAAERVAEWLAGHVHKTTLRGIGHRIVHGGLRLTDHAALTDEVMAELRRARSLDRTHLPREIALIEVIERRFAGVPQVACFDTEFHRDMPRVAKLLPIPRRYDDAGVRRLGFHGLSYRYLIDELRRVAGDVEADGKVILAHLGSGASMSALRCGKPIDTTMGFTPSSGLVMGTRPGDLDPGLLSYLMRAERLTALEIDEFVNARCGLLGVSETSGDMRDLIARREDDVRAAEAVELFCHQAKKSIGALVAVLGGLDALVFAGGIGERSPAVRDGICRDLGFLGLQLDAEANRRSAAVISTRDSRVVVRVIPTDEEVVIARAVIDRVAARPAMKETP